MPQDTVAAGGQNGAPGPSVSLPLSLDSPRSLSPSSTHSDNVQHSTWADLTFLEPILPPSVHHFCVTNLGLCLVAISQFFFACMNITVKYFLSVTGISIPTLILVRMGITMLGCWAALLVLRERDLFFGPPEYYKILTIRGSAGCIGLFCSYMSFRGLSVSDSITIQFLSPTVTLILGYFVLKESFQKREIAAGLCCLVGTMFVSRPPFLFGDGADGTEVPIDEGGSVIDPSEQGEGPTGSRMVAVGWALTAVFAASVAYISIRYMGTRVSPLHNMLYFTYACLPFCLLAILFTPGPFVWVTTWPSFILIMMCGIFGFIAQMLLTIGLQREKAGRASIALYLLVFYTIFLELVVFQAIPSILSLIGIAIILTSAFLAAKFTSTKPPSPDDIEADVDGDALSLGEGYPPPGHGLAKTTRVGYARVPDRDSAIELVDEGGADGVNKGSNGHLEVARPLTRRRSSATSGIEGDA